MDCMDEVTSDIKAVVDICHKYGTAVKVILETDALTKEQIVKGTKNALLPLVLIL